ncbi:acyltransferase family protein [Citrobacter freundii]
MGFLRLFLALSVISGHSRSTVFYFNGIGAWYAVNLFFIISGFYMAMVLNEKYKDTPVVTFYKSRALRLYPTYFVGILLSLIISGGFYYDVFISLTDKSKLFFLFQNFFIFGQDAAYLVCSPMQSGDCQNPVSMTINPPAWSLSVELIFYIVAPFIVKSPKITFIYFATGVFYLLILNQLTYPISIDYLSIAKNTSFFYYWYPSSFVFFAMGAFGYQFSKGMVNNYYILAVASFIAASYTVTIMPLWQMAALGMAIPSLFAITKKNKLDRMIGEMSFPAYILHFPILTYFQRHADYLKGLFDYISIGSMVSICSCLLGMVLYMTMERKIDKFRHEELTGEHAAVVSKVVKYMAMPVIFILPFTVLAYILL